MLEFQTSFAEKSAQIEALKAGQISAEDFAQAQAQLEEAKGVASDLSRQVESMQGALQAKTEELQSSSTLQEKLQQQVGCLEDHLKKMEEENASLHATTARMMEWESQARTAEAERQKVERELKEKDVRLHLIQFFLSIN